ncbi:RNA polymerase sigma factor region1.1 domain-containing protein, partial [Sulfurimonas sp. RIFOXYB12_FULL_35_9]|uniref:RNA polymerase sigma factor region1.1 domain-containing protein n=1 Tax=Sulfurimonas sp. RIFOXYB12_FULL_35_9 TaxID=1802256 RepID=UPI0025D181D5
MAAETHQSGENMAISNTVMEKLIKKGKKTGSLSYAEINDAITEDLKSPDQIEDVFMQFKELGIKLIDKEKM